MGAFILDLYIPNSYRDRIRILLIIYFFSEGYKSEDTPGLVKVLYSEVKIQKIDFLIRYPDYFCYELIELMKEDDVYDRNEIREIIKAIFNTKEPEIRRDEMLRYIFGAYEDIDNIISFWMSVGFILYESKVNIMGKAYDKAYYLTLKGKNQIESEIIPNMESARWYIDRCSLIKKYFDGMTGTELKERQYKYSEYRGTAIGSYITEIGDKVREEFFNVYGEGLKDV